jgi:arylsulfatase A
MKLKNGLIPMMLSGLLLLGGCSKETRAPNIVIFLADDLGYGDLGCYGNPIIKTPHIDQLTREGVMMTDCHSGGTVCSPSRSAKKIS